MNCAQFCKLLLCRMGTLSDTAIRPSVCPSVCRSLGYWHVSCLQLAGHQRCADCGASGTVIGGGISSRDPGAITCLLYQYFVYAGIAILLALSFYQMTVNEKLPATSDAVPLMGKQ